jgi:hypothetical protein
MCEKPDHPHLPNLAGFEKLHPAHVMRPDPPMQTHLHDPPRFARRLEHRAALVDRMAGRLLYKHVRSCFQRIDGLQRVPVIGCRDDHHLRLFLFEQLTVVLVNLRRIAAPAVHLIGGDLQHIAVHVAKPNHLAAIRRRRFLQNILPPPTTPNERGLEFRGFALAEDIGSAREEDPGRFDKGATFHVISCGGRRRQCRPGSFGNTPIRWRAREPSSICH